MSFVEKISLKCDRCGHTTGAVFASHSYAIQVCGKAGWRLTSFEDVCPRCVRLESDDEETREDDIPKPGETWEFWNPGQPAKMITIGPEGAYPKTMYRYKVEDY